MAQMKSPIERLSGDVDDGSQVSNCGDVDVACKIQPWLSPMKQQGIRLVPKEAGEESQ